MGKETITVDQFVKENEITIDQVANSDQDRRLIVTLIQGAYFAGQHYQSKK